jgi:hypothetical protein
MQGAAQEGRSHGGGAIHHAHQIGLARGLFWQPTHVELIASPEAGPCDLLGIEPASAVVARKEAEGKAVGAGCRQAARSVEQCFALNRRADKAAVFAGWREMNDYMREYKMEAMPPEGMIIEMREPTPFDEATVDALRWARLNGYHFALDNVSRLGDIERSELLPLASIVKIELTTAHHAEIDRLISVARSRSPGVLVVAEKVESQGFISKTVTALFSSKMLLSRSKNWFGTPSPSGSTTLPLLLKSMLVPLATPFTNRSAKAFAWLLKVLMPTAGTKRKVKRSKAESPTAKVSLACSANKAVAVPLPVKVAFGVN